jgi:hypothetical protein
VLSAPLELIRHLILLYPEAVNATEGMGHPPLHTACYYAVVLSDVLRLLPDCHIGDDASRRGLSAGNNCGRLPLSFRLASFYSLSLASFCLLSLPGNERLLLIPAQCQDRLIQGANTFSVKQLAKTMRWLLNSLIGATVSFGWLQSVDASTPL